MAMPQRDDTIGSKGSSMYCVKGESEKTLFGSEP